jgi:hypothetical protein
MLKEVIAGGRKCHSVPELEVEKRLQTFFLTAQD